MQINSAKDLNVYKKAYSLSMEIFRASRGWPSEERYSLTDHIRRSSRSVCANLREAWAKRRYEVGCNAQEPRSLPDQQVKRRPLTPDLDLRLLTAEPCFRAS